METAEQFFLLAIVPVPKTLTPSVEQQKKIHNLCSLQNTPTTEKVQSSRTAVELREQQPVQPNLVSEPNPAGTQLEGFIGLSLLLGLSLGGVLYNKYRAYRTTVLLRQIEVLEKLWRTST